MFPLDIYRGIASYLDNFTRIALARTCRHLHAAIPQYRPTPPYTTSLAMYRYMIAYPEIQSTALYAGVAAADYDLVETIIRTRRLSRSELIHLMQRAPESILRTIINRDIYHTAPELGAIIDRRCTTLYDTAYRYGQQDTIIRAITRSRDPDLVRQAYEQHPLKFGAMSHSYWCDAYIETGYPEAYAAYIALMPDDVIRRYILSLNLPVYERVAEIVYTRVVPDYRDLELAYIIGWSGYRTVLSRVTHFSYDSILSSLCPTTTRAMIEDLISRGSELGLQPPNYRAMFSASLSYPVSACIFALEHLSPPDDDQYIMRAMFKRCTPTRLQQSAELVIRHYSTDIFARNPGYVADIAAYYGVDLDDLAEYGCIVDRDIKLNDKRPIS